MKDQNFPVTSNLITARELLKLGNVNATIMCLEEDNEQDIAITQLERGDPDGALHTLTTRAEGKFSIYKYIQGRCNTVMGTLENNVGKFEREYLESNKRPNKSNRNSELSFPYNSPVFMLSGQRSITPATVPNLIGTIVAYSEMQYKGRVLYPRIGISISLNNKLNKTIPTETAEINAVWLVPGGGSVSVDDPAWGSKVDVTPHTLFTKIRESRQLFIQITEYNSDVLLSRLNWAMDKEIDRVIFYGSGSSGEPKGAYNISGVVRIDGASLDKVKLDEMERRVADSDAPDDNKMYLIAPLTEEKLKHRPIVSGGDKMIIRKGKLNDQSYLVSKRITEGHLWWGHFGTIVLSLFENRELSVNPFFGDVGDVDILQWMEVDVSLRQPTWIVCAENIT